MAAMPVGSEGEDAETEGVRDGVGRRVGACVGVCEYGQKPMKKSHRGSGQGAEVSLQNESVLNSPS